MDWIKDILNPAVLSLLIPIVAIIGAFSLSAFKAHHKHLERIETSNRGWIQTNNIFTPKG